MKNEHLEKLNKIIDRLASAITMGGRKLQENEITEQQLFCLIKAKEELKHLVIEIDPDRFGDVRSYTLTSQEMKVDRLHLCTICGSTRCQSDHK